MHYQRQRITGSAGRVESKSEVSPVDRFVSKLDAHSDDGCWLWCGNKGAGYGRFWANGDFIGAHRQAYGWLIGPIPDGLHIDHLCRTPACVNPRHLEPVLPKINYLRGFGAAAINARKTHCKYGHKLAGENLRVYPDGHRECKTCRRRLYKEWEARNRI
jgi:hypothetical protein